MTVTTRYPFCLRPARCRSSALPDPNSVGRRKIERMTGLHLVRGIPGVKIPYRSHADSIGRVLIGRRELSQDLLAPDRAPTLGKTEEEALIPALPIDHRG